MILEIFIKEIREQLITTKMLVSSTLIVVLLIINGYIFNLNYNRRFDKYLEIYNNNQEHIRKNSTKLIDLIFENQRLIKPPSKLAFISEAEEKVLPNGLELNYFTESNPQYYKRQNIYFSTFNSIDWAYILLVFISFICISFSYSAFSGEKVNGTLKLMLSNTITRWQIILGKYFGILIIILIPFLIGIIINLIVLEFNPNLFLKLDDFLMIILFLICTILFISLNILMGFLISCLTQKPVISLSFILIFWIIFNIVIPNISWLLSKKMAPVDSFSKLNETEAQRMYDIDHSGKYSTSWNSDWEDDPPNELVLKRAAGAIEKNKAHNEIWRGYRNTIIAQTKTAINVSKISPFSIFRFVAETISDNGFSGYVNFYYQLRNYQINLQNFLNQKDQADKDSYHLIWDEHWATQFFMSKKGVSFEEIPQFEYQPPSFNQTLNNCKWDILILVLWNLVLFTGTFVAFVRYDVR